jgi:hypothetical protein
MDQTKSRAEKPSKKRLSPSSTDQDQQSDTKKCHEKHLLKIYKSHQHSLKVKVHSMKKFTIELKNLIK